MLRFCDNKPASALTKPTLHSSKDGPDIIYEIGRYSEGRGELADCALQT